MNELYEVIRGLDSLTAKILLTEGISILAVLNGAMKMENNAAKPFLNSTIPPHCKFRCTPPPVSAVIPQQSPPPVHRYMIGNL